MDDHLRQLITLGRGHYNAGEYEAAEPYLSEVVEHERTFPDIFNMLGVICHTQGRFEEAESAFETALELNPNYTDAALNLSVTYNDRGKYDKARQVYSRAISFADSGSGSESAAGTNGAPRGLGTRLDPFARGKISNMHADLGAVYASAGLYEQAVREYSSALELCPDFIDIRTRLGLVYRDMGKADAALTELEQVKRSRPDYIPSRIYLGVTLYSLGRVQDAAAEWREVLALQPGNKSAALYLRMIEDAPS